MFAMRIPALAALVLFAACVNQAAHAQPAWRPDKNVELIVPSNAGSGADASARLIQKIWQDTKLFESTVTVNNKPGGGGAVAWTYLNTHPGDGHYLAFTSATLLTNKLAGLNPIGYTDVTPIANLLSEYIAFSVKADSPLRNARDLLERIKSDPASLSFGLATSAGNPNHMAIAKIVRSVGADPKKLKVVVFSSSAQSFPAVLGGHVDVIVTNISNPVQQIEAKAMRAIAVTAPKRLTGIYANVPTWRELGIDTVMDNWRGVVGAKAMTPAQVALWEVAFRRLSQSDEWKKDLDRSFQEINFIGSRDVTKFLAAELEENRVLLNELGMTK